MRARDRAAGELEPAAIGATAGDIVVGGVLTLFHALGGLEDAPENVTAYIESLRGRPAFGAAVQRVEPIALQ
jgi:glutathione S-transferase